MQGVSWYETEVVMDRATALRPRLAVESVRLIFAPCIDVLLGVMSDPSYPENEYLMKALLRLLSFVSSHGLGTVGPVSDCEDVLGLTDRLLGDLTAILVRVVAQPKNPLFNHFLFEAIAALVRATVRAVGGGSRTATTVGGGGGSAVPSLSPAQAEARDEAVARFEAHLFPPFTAFLSEQAELLPYVFQLLAELLEMRPVPEPGADVLSDAYRSLLPPLLSPELWGSRGNVPALVVLLRSYLRRGASWLASEGHIRTLAEISDRLVRRRVTEKPAFELASALVENVAADALGPWLTPLIRGFLEVLKQEQAVRILRPFIRFAALLAGKLGPAVYTEAFDRLEPNLTLTILNDVIVPNANKVLGALDRKVVTVGLSRLLCGLPALMGSPRAQTLWANLVVAIVHVFEAPQDTFVEFEEAMADEIDAQENELASAKEEFQAEYARLSHVAAAAAVDPFPEIVEPRAEFVESIRTVAVTHPGRVKEILATTPVVDIVRGYCATAGVHLP